MLEACRQDGSPFGRGRASGREQSRHRVRFECSSYCTQSLTLSACAPLRRELPTTRIAPPFQRWPDMTDLPKPSAERERTSQRYCAYARSRMPSSGWIREWAKPSSLCAAFHTRCKLSTAIELTLDPADHAHALDQRTTQDRRCTSAQCLYCAHCRARGSAVRSDSQEHFAAGPPVPGRHG